MRKHLLPLLAIIMVLLSLQTQSHSQELTRLFTIEYSPLSIKKGSSCSGMACELARLLTRNNNTKISFGIWSKVYQQTLKSKNTGIFPTTLTDERKPLFSWVGPFCTSRYYIYQSTTKNRKISSKDDIKNVSRIATVKDYALNDILRNDYGCNNLVEFKTPREAILSVILGKCDICIFPSFIIDAFHKESGYAIKAPPAPKPDSNGLGALIRGDNGLQLTYGTSIETYDEVTLRHKGLGQQNRNNSNGTPDITPIMLFLEEDLYFALNKETSQSIVSTLQDRLIKIQKSGILTKLFKKYHIDIDNMPNVAATPITNTSVPVAATPAKTTVPVPATIKPLTIYAENFPPLTFSVNDSTYVQGATAELVAAIQKNLKEPVSKIIIDDWNKVFNKVKDTPFSAICTLKRIPERENDFYWIGPYAADSAWLYARRDFPGEITDIAEARKIQRIACIDQTFAHSTLINNDFKNIITFNAPDGAVQTMLDNPEDAAAFSSVSAPYLIRQAGYSPINVRPILQLSKKTNYYIGISKSTPEAVAKKWQNAFEQLKADGTLNMIIQRWIK